MKRAGVTLVEMMIALVILSVFASTLTLMVVRSSVTDEAVDARREARGVARASLNIVESEMRMAEPSGVIVPTDDSTLTFNQPFAFGLVCGVTGGNAVISLLPSADLPGSLTVDGYAGWAYRDSTGTYQYQPTTSLSGGTTGTCTAANIAAFTASSGRVVQVPSGVALASGTVAFLYRQITYSLRASTALPGRRGLYRTAGANAAEELATPFASTARFRWYILGAAEADDTLPTDFEDLSGVQFVLTAESKLTPRTSTAPVQAPFTTSVFFQNRPN
ncbi:MAG TPA: prepilin-type N-terminal cleavage/methylation domain-containing protein [Gemmatimonadales bacterium]|jgi:prepilin-type N-terminal cleavage/methylation domain-containing protein